MNKFTFQRLNPIKDFLPLKEYFIQNRRALILGLMFMFFTDFFQVLIPLIIKRAIDLLTFQSSDSLMLLKQAGAIIGLSLSIAVLRYVWRYLLIGHSRIVEEGLRNRLFEHMESLSYSFYKRMKTGDIMSRAINDIIAIRMAAGFGLVALADGLVLGIAAIGFMISINVKLTLISLIPTPLIIILTKHLTRRMSLEFETVQKTFSGLTERVREAFSGIRVIKAYNREEWERERLRKEGEVYINANMKLAKSLALFFPVMAIFTNAGLAIVIWYGGRQTILGDITTGDFVAFISYLNLLTWPMMAMGWVANLIQRGAASMRRVSHILKEVPEIKDSENSMVTENLSGSIKIYNLTFRYPGDTREVLKNIYKGAHDPGYYKNLFENAVYVARAEKAGKPVKHVTVYTTPTCSWCNTLKSYLRKHQVRFTEIDVSSNETAAREMVNKSGQQGVPQTSVNGSMVIGFDKTKLNRLLEISE